MVKCTFVIITRGFHLEGMFFDCIFGNKVIHYQSEINWVFLVIPEAGGDSDCLVTIWFQLFYQIFVGNISEFGEDITPLPYLIIWCRTIHCVLCCKFCVH